MSLRRFPWKQPRLTDNSYRLFVSTPNLETPGIEPTARKASDGRPKSEIENKQAVEESGPKPTQAGAARSDEETEGRRHNSHHHHHHEEKPTDREKNTASASTQSSNPKQEVIKGPWRLLRLLPRESRKIMGRMLQVDPKNRATLDEMMQDPWVTYAPVCRQVDGGQVVRASGHEHTLEPSVSAPAAPT